MPEIKTVPLPCSESVSCEFKINDNFVSGERVVMCKHGNSFKIIADTPLHPIYTVTALQGDDGE